MPLIYNIMLLFSDFLTFFVCYITITYNTKLYNIMLLFSILIIFIYLEFKIRIIIWYYICVKTKSNKL